MTGTEFYAIVRDMLTEPWGEKNYPKPVLERLWRMVKDVTPGEFRQALDSLMMTSTRAPTLGQVAGSCRPAINRAADDRRREAVTKLGAHTCELCGGSGWVTVIPFDQPLAEGSFICTLCESAKIRGIGPSRGAVYWEDEFANKYFVRRFTTASALEAHEHHRRTSETVQALRQAEAARRLPQTPGVQGWANELMQAMREGKSVGSVLRQSLDLSGQDENT